MNHERKKFSIWETLNLLTNANSSTNTKTDKIYSKHIFFQIIIKSMLVHSQKRVLCDGTHTKTDTQTDGENTQEPEKIKA